MICIGELIIEQFCSSDHSALLQGAGHGCDSEEQGHVKVVGITQCRRHGRCVRHRSPKFGEVLIRIVANAGCLHAA